MYISVPFKFMQKSDEIQINLFYLQKWWYLKKERCKKYIYVYVCVCVCAEIFMHLYICMCYEILACIYIFSLYYVSI